MDIFTLDASLRRTEIIDVYKSLIWTERWQDAGELQLDLSDTPKNRALISVGTFFAIKESKRVMVCDSIEKTRGADGERLLKVRGASLEMFLQNRVARRSMNVGYSDEPDWLINGTPGNIARTMFNHICRPAAGLHPDDLIPFITSGSLYPPSTIVEHTGLYFNWKQRPDTLFNAIRTLCQDNHLGFRFVRGPDTSALYFDVYAGVDRTVNYRYESDDNEDTIIIFDERVDDFFVDAEFVSNRDFRNVVYVINSTSTEQYYRDVDYGAPGDPLPPYQGFKTGFDRRVAVHTYNPNAPDLAIQWPDYHQGAKVLRNKKFVSLKELEINRTPRFHYDVDYALGDIIDVVHAGESWQGKRVIEYIFVSDAQGVRQYPTLDEPQVQYVPPTFNPQ